METLEFKCYKISKRIQLDKIESSFRITKALKWKDYITLKEGHIDAILESNAKNKSVYLFEYGCVCFVNFNENEIYTFLRYIGSIVGGVDYSLFSSFNESHKESEKASIPVGLISSVCIILAKSVELNKLESDLEHLLDGMDRLISFLQSGKFHINRKLVAAAAKIVRLEYHYANNIKIFDRNIYENDNQESIATFDRLSMQYELDGRLAVIQNKMEDIRNIISAYSGFSYNRRETGAYWFEIILLALFPLAYLVEHIF